MTSTVLSDVHLLFYFILQSLVSLLIGRAAASGKQTKRIYAEVVTKRSPALFSPPPIVFAIAWAILYLLQAFAAWVMQRGHGFAENNLLTAALSLHVVLLVFLAAWTWIFFAAQWYGAALLWIILTFFIAAATDIFFFLQHALAGGLLIPLLLWLFYASILNAIAVYNARQSKRTSLQK